MSERDENREILESLINNWNAEFDELEARIRKAGSDPKDDYDGVITALRQHRSMAKAEPGSFEAIFPNAYL